MIDVSPYLSLPTGLLKNVLFATTAVPMQPDRAFPYISFLPSFKLRSLFSDGALLRQKMAKCAELKVAGKREAGPVSNGRRRLTTCWFLVRLNSIDKILVIYRGRDDDFCRAGRHLDVYVCVKRCFRGNTIPVGFSKQKQSLHYILFRRDYKALFHSGPPQCENPGLSLPERRL